MPDTHTDAKKDEFAGMTAGPWHYRPNKFDDWGFVRAASGDLVARASSGRYETEEELAAHRRNKTDPAEANARAIAALPDIIARLTKAEAEVTALTAERDQLRGELDDLESAWRGANDVIAGQRTHLADLGRERDRLAGALEDAVDTLESMDLHIDSPLYERLRAALSGAPARGEEKR